MERGAAWEYWGSESWLHCEKIRGYYWLLCRKVKPERSPKWGKVDPEWSPWQAEDSNGSPISRYLWSTLKVNLATSTGYYTVDVVIAVMAERFVEQDAEER